MYMGKLELVMETDCVSIYSPKYDGESLTEFHKFLQANKNHTQRQLILFYNTILSRINKITKCGARENLFRLEGGKIKALPLYVEIPRYKKSIGKMRLYCIRISDRLLILGNGGVTTAVKYEDDPVMLSAVNDLRKICKQIQKGIDHAQTDYEDFDAVRLIIESITL